MLFLLTKGLWTLDLWGTQVYILRNANTEIHAGKKNYSKFGAIRGNCKSSSQFAHLDSYEYVGDTYLFLFTSDPSFCEIYENGFIGLFISGLPTFECSLLDILS